MKPRDEQQDRNFPQIDILSPVMADKVLSSRNSAGTRSRRDQSRTQRRHNESFARLLVKLVKFFVAVEYFSH